MNLDTLAARAFALAAVGTVGVFAVAVWIAVEWLL